MTLIALCGFETGDTAAAKSSAGTFSFVNSGLGPVQSSGWLLKVNPTLTGTGYVGLGIISGTTGAPAFFASGGTIQRFYFRAVTLPATLDEQFISCQSTAAAQNWALRLTSAGAIALYSSANALIATSSAGIINANTDYLIEIASDNSGTGLMFCTVNGVAAINTTCAMGSSPGEISLGKRTNRNGKTVEFWYDHWILTDGNYIEVHGIFGYSPINDGSVNDFTAGTGISDFQELDEIPVDTTTYVQSAAAANKNVLVRFNSAASHGPVGGLRGIKGVQAWALGVRENTSATSACKVQLKSGGGTVGNATALNATTTPANLAVLAVTDPNTTQAWTTAGFDLVEAGLNLGATNAIAVRLSGVLLEIAYVQDGIASGAIGTITLTAPAGGATGGAAATGAIGTITLTAPAGGATGGAAATGTIPTITLTAPDAVATGGAAATGDIGTITLTAPTATASGETSGQTGTPACDGGDTSQWVMPPVPPRRPAPIVGSLRMIAPLARLALTGSVTPASIAGRAAWRLPASQIAFSGSYSPPRTDGFFAWVASERLLQLAANYDDEPADDWAILEAVAIVDQLRRSEA